jgi:hypothetical protein
MADALEINEQPRDLRYGDSVRSPVVRLVAQARGHREAQNDLLARLARERFEIEQVLKQVSDHVEGNTAHEWNAVGIIRDRLGALLTDFDVTVEDPSGQPWVDTMREDYDVGGVAQRSDVPAPYVFHLERPLVRRWGQRVSKGRVLVHAPESKPNQPSQDQPEGKGD